MNNTATAALREFMDPFLRDYNNVGELIFSEALFNRLTAHINEHYVERQPQPTTEGAEEITDEFLDDNFHRRCEGCEEKPAMVSKLLELATLTADKIVEGKIREAVNKEKDDIRKWLIDEGYELLSEKV